MQNTGIIKFEKRGKRQALNNYDEETHFQDSDLIETTQINEEPENFTPLSIGDLFIDKYRIVKVLGRGHSSIIYLIASVDNNRELYALKEFFPKGLVYRRNNKEVVLNPSLTKLELKHYYLMQEIFIGEAHNMMKISSKKHKNVIHFLELHKNINNTNYYRMDYKKGNTLKEYLEDNQRASGAIALKTNEIIELASNLLDGLEHIHLAGIYHQDLKLDNIIIGEDGKPTILDFGASVLIHDKNNSKYYNTATLKYAAPEQINIDKFPKINQTTDIYNLGTLLYYLVTGTFPPKASDRLRSLKDDKKDLYVPLAEQSKSKDSKSLYRSIDISLSLAQEDRFQNTVEFQKSLRRNFPNKFTITSLSIMLALVLAYVLLSEKLSVREPKITRNLHEYKLYKDGNLIHKTNSIITFDEGNHTIAFENNGSFFMEQNITVGRNGHIEIQKLGSSGTDNDEMTDSNASAFFEYGPHPFVDYVNFYDKNLKIKNKLIFKK